MKRASLRMTAALVLGFGATVGMWLLAGYYFTQRMAAVQRDSVAVNSRYMQAQELLSMVRTQVLLGSVYVRDALLDPDAGEVDTYRRQFETTYENVDHALEQYVPILNSAAERDRVNGLRKEIDGFKATLEGVLASDRAQWRSQAPILLNRIMPMRASVMQVSDDIQRLNRSAFVQQQQEVAEIYESTQRRVWEAFGLTLAASLGIGLIAAVYVIRFERDLQRQREKEIQTTNDLHRLSSKLMSVQEEERRKIARELHDEVGQVLTAIKVELSIAQRRLEALGGASRLLDDAQSMTAGALNTVRHLSHLLHPAVLDDLGLPVALDGYLTGFEKRFAVRTKLLHDGMEERLAPDLEAAIYRIVQEALTNVAKHANATRASVCLHRAAEVIQLTIEDDGVGFVPRLVCRGLGLISIRERVAQLRGTMHVDSAPETGTRLSVQFPLSLRVPNGDAEPEVAQDSHPNSEAEPLRRYERQL